MKRSTFIQAVTGMGMGVSLAATPKLPSVSSPTPMQEIKTFTNGFPKTGNHALVKACELLGVPATVQHVPFAAGKPDRTTHSVMIKRDPRNVIISMLRFQGRQVTPGTFLAKFRSFDQARLIVEMAAYEGWLSDPGTLVVKFEELIASDGEIRRIAAHLGVPYIDGAFGDLPGYTRTWTGQYSDYRTVWTAQIENAWNNEGGKELLERWGY